MDRSFVLPLAAIAAVLVLVLTGALPAAALLTLLGGLGIKNPLAKP